MADRKQFSGTLPVDEELQQILLASKGNSPTEEVLREQRISFAFGNAMNVEGITKDSVRESSQHLRLRP